MLKFRPNAPVHGGSIALLDCLFRHHSRLHPRLQGSLNLTLHKSQASVHQGSPLMHESFPESSIRTGRVFGPVGQVFMHQGASLEHLRSLRPRAEQALTSASQNCNYSTQFCLRIELRKVSIELN